jgi:hypothetical protein
MVRLASVGVPPLLVDPADPVDLGGTELDHLHERHDLIFRRPTAARGWRCPPAADTPPGPSAAPLRVTCAADLTRW